MAFYALLSSRGCPAREPAREEKSQESAVVFLLSEYGISYFFRPREREARAIQWGRKKHASELLHYCSREPCMRACTRIDR